MTDGSLQRRRDGIARSLLLQASCRLQAIRPMEALDEGARLDATPTAVVTRAQVTSQPVKGVTIGHQTDDDAEASQVAVRPRETDDKAHPDWVANVGEDDRDRRGCVFLLAPPGCR